MLIDLYRLCATTLPIALEGLPVSSSGHVLLGIAFLARVGSHMQPLPQELDHLVHLPIALMVALFFMPRWWYLLTHINKVWRQFFKVLYLGFITVLVTALIYGAMQYVGTGWFPLWLGYAFTTALLFSLRNIPYKVNGQWTLSTAIILGAAQGLALLPGVSRLGITYVVARWLGMRSQKAFELSFLIEWPISVAGFLKGFYDMHNAGTLILLTRTDIMLVCGATIVGFFGLWIMQKLVRNQRVWQIGWYTLCLTCIAFFLR